MIKSDKVFYTVFTVVISLILTGLVWLAATADSIIIIRTVG